MKRTPITAFQSQCHSILKYIHATGVPVIITKRGKPLVKIIPIKSSPTEIFGFMAGEFQITGDIESPIFRCSPGRE
jgi:prevent-host-death family protein